MITTTIVFDHRGRTKATELGPIEVRVIVNRKPYYINTGVRVYKNEFRFGTIINRPDASELQKRVVLLAGRVEQEINTCIEKGLRIDVREIRSRLTDSRDSSEPSLLSWIDSQIPLLRVSEPTRLHYRTLFTRLCEYGRMRLWSDVSVEAIMHWDAYLRTLPSLSDAGIYNYHKNLKALLNRAEAMNVIQSNPYNRLRGKFKRCDRESVEYLTEQQMQSIMSLSFPQGTLLQKACDLFIFQMFTGLAYTDSQKFSIDDYKIVDGNYINIGTRIKTGTPYISQLLPPVLDVLERNGNKVPKLDNADYNHALKLIGEIAEIPIRMHSHLARHTFATYMLRNGVKIENLARMLGHTNITQTQRYAKVLAQSVHEEFAKIATKILTKNKK